ncbi:malate/lactate/ureidoglycolate dehydrogenase [Sulfitobacter guttiformis]|uniref:Putative oxidoreductase n=1 Tax=Sulfitobacter guttiformis TaxID=74349 RepID=A0A420DPF0_9RHOB|nr:malate/lactate/ureidoglycolate dehydrogenase [Sulfitobacter guttiformis]KIN73493.1 L-lactate dehydrogenase [Sulfitobacter guttiformis KCTC 32187]RKE96151.1 putative oxidoreductase [Sulfitobacter guttiformis]
MNISADDLTKIAESILAAASGNVAKAEKVAKRLVDANLTGHDSHGVGMIPAYVDGILAQQLHPDADAKIVEDKGPFLLVDGQYGFGHIVAEQAMNHAIERAKSNHFAVLSLRNSFHLGRLGDWGAMAAEAGFICILYANVQSPRPIVAPFGGSDARFVTNPYCTAIPATEKTPMFLLDMATSTIAMGKARVANLSGNEVPDGALIDAKGNPTNDPSVMFDDRGGSLTTFGQHKGFGLALLGDILGGSFSGGGAYLPEREIPASITNNMLAILIDPDVFGMAEAFGVDMDRYAQWVKSSPPAPGVDAVQFPGDPERKTAQTRRANGIPLDAGTMAQLSQAAVKANVPLAQMGALTDHE